MVGEIKSAIFSDSVFAKSKPHNLIEAQNGQEKTFFKLSLLESFTATLTDSASLRKLENTKQDSLSILIENISIKEFVISDKM